MTILVPAYFYPLSFDPNWAGLFDARANIMAIINPKSGPGTVRDPCYSWLGRVSRSTLKFIGYVATTYGAKPLPTVLGEVDRMFQFYPFISGVFFDEAPSDPGFVSYSNEIVRFAGGNGNAILNFGTIPDGGYAAIPSGAVLFEGDYDKFVAEPFLRTNKFANRGAIVESVDTRAKAHIVIAKAKAQGFGFIYMTDEPEPASYARLPKPEVWNELIAA
jgi:hypothetical protein